MSSTLVVGDVFGSAQGYYADFAVGSLTPPTLGGLTCLVLITGSFSPGNIAGSFQGNHVAALTGQTLTLDGVEYSQTGTPAYEAGSDATSVFWPYPSLFTIGASYTVSFGADVTSPVITSPDTALVESESILSHALTANEAVTWSVVGGADQAQFEISGSTLRWTGNGSRDYTDPQDADGNNAYLVTVRATDGAANSSDQSITVTVKNPFLIQQRITDTNNDGYSFDTSWQSSGLGTSVSSNQQGGARFPGIAIPENATIVTATLTLVSKAATNVPTSGQVNGVAGVSAPWSSTIRPNNAVKTVASCPLQIPTIAETLVHDVKDIAQEIVNNAAWVSGSAMGFVLQALTGSSAAYYADVSDDAPNAAYLEILWSLSPPVPDTVYKGASGKAVRYIGSKSDAAAYIGAGDYWPA